MPAVGVVGSVLVVAIAGMIGTASGKTDGGDRAGASSKSKRQQTIFVDGGKISVWAINANGRNRRLIANHAGLAKLTPNGKRVYFLANYGLVSVMRPDGSHQRKLRGRGEAFSHRGDLSQTGRLAFIGVTMGDPLERPNIQIVNADGSGKGAVYSPGAEVAFITTVGISGDGQRIAFTEVLNSGPGSRLRVINSDGSGLRTLFTNPTAGGDVEDPSFSPDGGRVAFVSGVDNHPGNEEDLLLINVDGSGLRTVTPTPAVGERSPIFSPDGKRLAFATFSGDLFTIGLDGLGRKQLSRGIGTPTSWGRIVVKRR
jgi:Tol biopolymer transport system component